MCQDIFGCDIGNGFSFISILDEKGNDPRPMLPASEEYNAAIGMPSDAYVTPPDGSSIIVFDYKKGGASKKIMRDRSRAVRAVKTMFVKDEIRLDGITNPISPYDVYAAVTRDLVKLGNIQRAADAKPPVYKLIMTFPSCFLEFENGVKILNKMQNAIENVDLDGHQLEVIRRLPEPGAVAIDYLSFTGKEEHTVLVYDLGNGTFDAAVVTARSHGEPFDIWRLDGLSDVGGKNFDRRLEDYILREMKNNYSYEPVGDTELESLHREVIQLKHSLTDNTDDNLNHQSRRDGTYISIPVSRREFEELTEDLLMETLICTQKVIEEYLAGGEGRKIDAIVLSGGASKMPMVQNALEEFGFPVYLFRPSEAVSFGASRYAENVAQLFTHNSYMVRNEINGGMDVFLDANQPLPVESKPMKLQLHAGRNDVRVYRPSGKEEEKNPYARNYVNLAILHFDIPAADEFDVVMKVSDDYNITITLINGTNEISQTTRFESKKG